MLIYLHGKEEKSRSLVQYLVFQFWKKAMRGRRLLVFQKVAFSLLGGGRTFQSRATRPYLCLFRNR